MYFPHSVSYHYYDELRKGQLREAKQKRMLRQAGIDTRGWATVQVHRMVRSVGRLLIFLGHKLHHLGEPAAIYSPKTQLDAFV